MEVTKDGLIPKKSSANDSFQNMNENKLKVEMRKILIKSPFLLVFNRLEIYILNLND